MVKMEFDNVEEYITASLELQDQLAQAEKDHATQMKRMLLKESGAELRTARYLNLKDAWEDNDDYSFETDSIKKGCVEVSPVPDSTDRVKLSLEFRCEEAETTLALLNALYEHMDDDKKRIYLELTKHQEHAIAKEKFFYRFGYQGGGVSHWSVPKTAAYSPRDNNLLHIKDHIDEHGCLFRAILLENASQGHVRIDGPWESYVTPLEDYIEKDGAERPMYTKWKAEFTCSVQDALSISRLIEGYQPAQELEAEA
jgi:hypothetical protein